MRGGATSNYSAEMWEYLHKDIMKNAYKRTNKRHFTGQIFKHNYKQDMMHGLKFLHMDVTIRRKRHTNWDEVCLLSIFRTKGNTNFLTPISLICFQADRRGKNVLPKTKKGINLASEEVRKNKKWRRLEQSLKTYLSNQYEELPNHLYSVRLYYLSYVRSFQDFANLRK